MRAPLAEEIAAQPFAQRAADIVRSCVHCGFCNATCPTYQLTGDELEGPRGRIYLIKSLLEEGRAGEATRRHLEQCLVCRNCETTCPSGVRYGDLLELVRPRVQALSPAPWWQRAAVAALLAVVPYRRRFAPLVALGRAVRPLLPGHLAEALPPRRSAPSSPRTAHARRVLLLGGCVQPLFNPAIDAAAAQVLDRVGISVIDGAGGGCCGALAAHLGDEEAARAQARANVEHWWPHVAAGAEAVLATSSACALQLKTYARVLAGDADYAERAERLAALVRDPLELIDAGALAPAVAPTSARRVAVQAPCTLQHGQRLGGRLEQTLRTLGFEILAVPESHLCCGAAGSHALLHPQAAGRLRERKLDNLMHAGPEVIATANIGCQGHLAARAKVPVMHWLELVAENLVPR